MDFELTESQQQLRNDLRTFVQTEIEPQAIHLDQNQVYPENILSELGDQCYTGLTLDEKYGGRGAGLVELAVVIEELSAGLMSIASSLALHLGVAKVIEQFGSETQKERFLPEMATFEQVGVLGLSEENAGSNKLEMETTAEEDGDEWVLNGHKQWVTNFLNADIVLTYAKTGPDTEAPHNISAFLVPTDKFEVEKVWDTLGAWSVKSPRVSLSNARIPDENLIGEAGEGYIQRGTVKTGINVPARGVGIARAALDDTVEYIKDREQFNQKISDFQGVRWNISEMAQRVDTARLLTFRAANRAEQGNDVSREFSMAKIYATNAAVDNANDAIQLHGGKGYTTEHHVQRYLRDARLLTIAGGPNELHKNTLAEAVLDHN